LLEGSGKDEVMVQEVSAFTEFKNLAVSIQTFSSILSLLHWDQETYMPKGGITVRGEQISLLSAYVHEMGTSRKYKNLLGRLVHLSSGKIKHRKLSRLDRIALREWHKNYLRNTSLPVSFIKEFARATTEASQIWQAAKKNNNFNLFAPFLEKIVRLNQEKAALYGFEAHPYDALLATYEPSMTTKRLTPIFSRLQKKLRDLLCHIQQCHPIDDQFLKGPFDSAKQFELGSSLLAQLPLDADFSRLDLSAHPFSIAMHPHDSRITTRILSNGFMSNLFSILHETGHSMYEMNLPAEHWGTPLAEAASLGIHESQSRLWETFIGRSLPFWESYYPLVKDAFTRQLEKVSLERFYRAINKVRPSCVRIEADEVTYCLHIILRYELELDLISGRLSVADLPYAWNEKMKEKLGVVPATDSEGCLQDIHWALGDFGYFPTYALGNLFAAQIYTVMIRQYPDWQRRIVAGDLMFIRDFLKKNIHSLGKQYGSEKLVSRLYGHPLDEKAYCHYLNEKYRGIYVR
jgi:carboxypeptidase Taq